MGDAGARCHLCLTWTFMGMVSYDQLNPLACSMWFNVLHSVLPGKGLLRPGWVAIRLVVVSWRIPIWAEGLNQSLQTGKACGLPPLVVSRSTGHSAADEPVLHDHFGVKRDTISAVESRKRLRAIGTARRLVLALAALASIVAPWLARAFTAICARDRLLTRAVNDVSAKTPGHRALNSQPAGRRTSISLNGQSFAAQRRWGGLAQSRLVSDECRAAITRPGQQLRAVPVIGGEQQSKSGGDACHHRRGCPVAEHPGRVCGSSRLAITTAF